MSQAKSPTYCVMPHIGMALQNYGDVCACNVNKLSYHINGQRYTVDQGPIDQVWASETRQELADTLDRGEQHPSCRTCWDLEAAGRPSPRQTFNEKFGHLEPCADQPRLVVVKPGNTCNGACRMCNPATSSSWYQDDFQRQRLRNPNLDFKLYIQDFETVRNSFHPDNKNFWGVMNQWYKNMEFIDIYGGEPFLITGLWKGLQDAVNQGASSGIALQLHTNLTIWNPEYLDLLGQFKKVRLSLSIDSHIKEHFEYIRHKLNFEQCMTNAHRIVEYTQQYPNIEMGISLTIDNLNVWNLDEICQEIKKQFDIPIAFNYVTQPDAWYDIRHLPRTIKLQLIERYKNNPDVKEIVKFLMQTVPGCDMWWPRFCLETDKLDRIRNQSFAQVMPEWHAQLVPYWDYTKRHPEWFQ